MIEGISIGGTHTDTITVVMCIVRESEEMLLVRGLLVYV